MILLHYISTIRVVSYRRTYDSITLYKYYKSFVLQKDL